jgi:alpha-glucosidase
VWGCPGVPAGALDRSTWTAAADSERSEDGDQHPARHALDGKPDTWWHSDYMANPDPQLPHHLDVNFGGEQHTVTGIEMWPRFDHSNGRIGKYEVYVSVDGTSFGDTPVASGEWPDTKDAKVRVARGATERRSGLCWMLVQQFGAAACISLALLSFCHYWP